MLRAGCGHASDSSERLKDGFGLLDAGEAELAAEDNHGFKERRRVFASANGHPDGLEGLPGLQTKLCGSFAQCLVQRIVIEGCCGQNLKSMPENAQGHGHIATLRRDKLGGVVRSEEHTSELQSLRHL